MVPSGRTARSRTAGHAAVEPTADGRGVIFDPSKMRLGHRYETPWMGDGTYISLEEHGPEGQWEIATWSPPWWTELWQWIRGLIA